MAKYQGTYTTEYSQGSVNMVVEANSTFHAEELIKAQTGATEVHNIGMVRDNNSSSSNSGYSSFSLGFIPTVILGGIVLYGLSMFGGNQQQPTNPEPTLQQKIQERNDKIQTQYDEFFNTELQEDVVDGLGQDWDN